LIYTGIDQEGLVDGRKSNCGGMMPDSSDRPGSARAKVFRNGRSQAVRLPKAFRFEVDEVSVRREGDAVILEPIKKRDWPRGFWSNADRSRRDLELGDLPPLGGKLLDIEDEGA
jgi:antitoxin VapB